MKMKKNILSAFLLSTLCFQVALANTSYVNLHAEDEATIIIEDDFTSIKLDNSKAIEKVGVSNDGNEHGLVPGTWGANVTIADESYLIYKLIANENKEFNTLKLDINAKIWNQNDGTAHEVNAIKVFVSEDNVTFNEVKKIGQQGGDFTNLEQIDLSSYANNKKSLYVKIQLIQTKATGDLQDLWMLGVKVGKVKFTSTEKEIDTPIDEAITIEDNFKASHSDHAYFKTGVSYDANEHGLVPGAWGANVTIADESYLIYKLIANENKEFNTLKLDINAKIWNQNDGTAHEVNAIKVFVSEDNVTFNEVKTINNQGGNFVDLEQIDLSKHANGKQTLYVKIQLVQSTSIGESQELAWLGVKIGKIKFSLTEKDYVGPIIEYSHIKDDFTTEGDFLNAYKMVGVSNSSSKDHGLVPGNWDANITIADESYLMYKIIADEGVFSSLSLSINAKIWNQNDGTAHNENSIKIYAGLKENNLKEVQSLGLSSGHNMANEFKDFNEITLDPIAVGEHALYVKIVLNQSTSIGDVQDLWMVGVKLGSVDFKYSQEEAEFINITYKGLNNEDLFVDNKQVKNTILNGFTAPEIADYKFKGWFLDESYETELTANYRPTSDTTIYAKYEENKYDIVYMLDGGVNDSTNPENYTAKDNITLKDPTKDGYVFKGWYIEPTFEDVSKVSTINGELRADIVLFAKWEKASELEPTPSETPSSEPSIEPSSEPTSEVSSEPSSKVSEKTSSSEIINSSTNNTSSNEEKPNENKKGCKGEASTSLGLIALLGSLLLKKKKQ